jgi:hypothetical protein
MEVYVTMKNSGHRYSVYVVAIEGVLFTRYHWIMYNFLNISCRNGADSQFCREINLWRQFSKSSTFDRNLGEFKLDLSISSHMDRG